jgi:heme/copper-type cytochrome/quinol oxidase subunit 3
MGCQALLPPEQGKQNLAVETFLFQRRTRVHREVQDLMKSSKRLSLGTILTICLVLGYTSFEMASYAGQCDNQGEQIWLTFSSVLVGLASIGSLIIELIGQLDD